VRRLSLLLAVAGMAAAQDAPEARRGFEVASIRVHEGPLSRVDQYSVSGPRLVLGAFNVPFLLMEAYSVRNFQLSFTAQSATLDDYWDITAIAPGTGSPTRDQFRQLLQSLLADRFKLKIHRETREMPVYTLVVDKSGPKLQAGSGEAPCAARFGPEQPQDRNYRYQFKNCNLAPLANALQADRPVLDKTGLTGRYDITLTATPAFKMLDSTEPGDISLNDSIRQLGLRLEAQKAPIEVLVVDHVERPSEN
jgi:uncharacterized protein (TIGR03435 family)